MPGPMMQARRPRPPRSARCAACRSCRRRGPCDPHSTSAEARTTGRSRTEIDDATLAFITPLNADDKGYGHVATPLDAAGRCSRWCRGDRAACVTRRHSRSAAVRIPSRDRARVRRRANMATEVRASKCAGSFGSNDSCKRWSPVSESRSCESIVETSVGSVGRQDLA